MPIKQKLEVSDLSSSTHQCQVLRFQTFVQARINAKYCDPKNPQALPTDNKHQHTELYPIPHSQVKWMCLCATSDHEMQQVSPIIAQYTMTTNSRVPHPIHTPPTRTTRRTARPRTTLPRHHCNISTRTLLLNQNNTLYLRMVVLVEYNYVKGVFPHIINIVYSYTKKRNENDTSKPMPNALTKTA